MSFTLLRTGTVRAVAGQSSVIARRQVQALPGQSRLWGLSPRELATVQSDCRHDTDS